MHENLRPRPFSGKPRPFSIVLERDFLLYLLICFQSRFMLEHTKVSHRSSFLCFPAREEGSIYPIISTCLVLGPAFETPLNPPLNRCHKSIDEPSPIPLFTGEERGHVQSKKESLSDALKGAAPVFANAVNTPPWPALSIPIANSAPLLTIKPNYAGNTWRICIP